MRRKHCYCVYSSILYTSRQISNEACQAFYKRNLFVVVCCGQDKAQQLFSNGWELSPAKAPKIEYYAMKVVVFSTGGKDMNDYGEPQLLITYNELPKFCRTLQTEKRRRSGALAFIQLRLDLNGKVGIEGASAEGHKTVADSPAGGHPPSGTTIARTSIKTPLHVRKLLEPFRQLHGMYDPQIVGPVPEHYKAEIIAEMRKRAPKNPHLFDNVLASFQEVMDDFGAKDFTVSTLELQDTLGELDDARTLDERGRKINDVIMSGPYVGCTMCDAYKNMEFVIWTHLAWAGVKTGDFNTLQGFFMWRVPGCIGTTEREWVDASRCGYKIGMIFYLASRNTHPHQGGSDYLDDAIKALLKGMQYEPDNQLLDLELEECRELAVENKRKKSAKMAMRLVNSDGATPAQNIGRDFDRSSDKVSLHNDSLLRSLTISFL